MNVGIIITLSIVAFIVLAQIARKILKSVKGVGRLEAKPFIQPEPSARDWENVLAHPGDIRLETLHAGNVAGTVYGIINLKDKPELGIKEEKLKAPLLAHRITHGKFGEFLIDAGFDSAFAENSWGRFEGWLKKLGHFSVGKGQGIDQLLRERNVKLNGVFCTHFHEHQGGAPALPDDIPFVFGKGEREIAAYPFMYSRFLKDKSDLRMIDFNDAIEMPIVGKAVDLYGDGSLWAIGTPGHTQGHISYLINGEEGKYLIMGDICMCEKGYKLGVESGGRYSDDLDTNRKSFLKIVEFLMKYPSVHPVFGHESDQFKVEYWGGG